MASPPAHSRVSGNPGAAVRGPGSPLSRGRTEKCVDRLCVPAGVHPAKAGAGTSGGNFFDYTPTTLLRIVLMLDHMQPRSLRASSGDILKAERGVASCGGGL